MSSLSTLMPTESGAARRELPRTTNWRVLFLVILALVGAVSLLYVRQTSSLAATGYDVAELQNEVSRWRMRNEQLRLRIAQLQSLDRIDQLASSRLGMGPPQRAVYVAAPTTNIPPLPAEADAPPRDEAFSLATLLSSVRALLEPSSHAVQPWPQP